MFSDEAILKQTSQADVERGPDELYEDLAYWQTRVSEPRDEHDQDIFG